MPAPNHGRPQRRTPGVWSYKPRPIPSTPSRPARRTPAPRPRRPLLADLAAWLALTVIAGALLMLLASRDLLVALPVLGVYLVVSWLLWSTRRG